MTRGVGKGKKTEKIYIIRNSIEGERRKASLGWAKGKGMSSAAPVTRDGSHVVR
jgi:hypothetical protein